MIRGRNRAVHTFSWKPEFLGGRNKSDINFIAVIYVIEWQKGCACAQSHHIEIPVSQEHFIYVSVSAIRIENGETMDHTLDRMRARDVLCIEWWNGQTFCLNTELFRRTPNIFLQFITFTRKVIYLSLSNTHRVHIFCPTFSLSLLRSLLDKNISHFIFVIECKSLCCVNPLAHTGKNHPFICTIKNDGNELVEWKLLVPSIDAAILQRDWGAHWTLPIFSFRHFIREVKNCTKEK